MNICLSTSSAFLNLCLFRSTSPSAYCWSVKFRGFLCPQASYVGLSGKWYLTIVPCSIFNWKQNVGVFVNCYTFVNYSYSGEFVWRGWVTTSNYWWIPRGLIPQLVQIFAEASKGKTFVRICNNTHTGVFRLLLVTKINIFTPIKLSLPPLLIRRQVYLLQQNGLQLSCSLTQQTQFVQCTRWFWWNFAKKYWKVAKNFDNQKKSLKCQIYQ